MLEYHSDAAWKELRAYVYPPIPAVVLVMAILIVQILIAYLVNYNMKQSLIERIRFAE